MAQQLGFKSWRWNHGLHVDSHIPAVFAVNKVLFSGVGKSHFYGGYVNQPGARVKGHRLPVVATKRRGQGDFGLISKLFVGLHRPTGFRIDMAGPIHRHIIFGGNKFAGLAINYVEKPVFRRLHNDFTLGSFNLNIGQNHMLSGGVVPGFSRGGLVMPDVLAAVRVEGDDR